MKKIFLLIAFAAVLCSCEKMGKDGRVRKEVDWSKWYYDGLEEDGDKPSVMVMSFNVRYDNDADRAVPERNWANRREGCAKMLNTLRPLVMGVQEAYRSQANDLKNRCPGYEWIGIGRGGVSSDTEMTAIFYLKDSVRVEALGPKPENKGTFWLSETPDVRSKPAAASVERIATLVKVTHISTGKQFCYLNTHLDLETSVMEYEMVVIMEQVEARCGDLPVVMTGDWNTGDDDAIFSDMYDNHAFLNAREQAIIGDTYPTFNGFTGSSSKKLDHLFYRGFPSCSRFVTVRQQWEGYKYISDHYPVYAILNFE